VANAGRLRTYVAAAITALITAAVLLTILILMNSV